MITKLFLIPKEQLQMSEAEKSFTKVDSPEFLGPFNFWQQIN